MDIQAIAFDVNGTLIEITTEDDKPEIFRGIGHFLTYQGIDLRRNDVRDLYFSTLKEQQHASTEKYAEFDAVAIWRKIVDDHATDYTRSLRASKLESLPIVLAEMYRGISRRRLALYPYIHDVLDILRTKYKLAIVTDAQSAYARAELYKAGILDYFDPIIVSGDFGYRKPDPRLFQMALDKLGVAARNALYVGNDMHRDVFGARELGMTTVMYNSDQGTKEYEGCCPDYTITDYRDLLRVLDIATPTTTTN
jgi:putative hydrolase of the HAD superfamily